MNIELAAIDLANEVVDKFKYSYRSVRRVFDYLKNEFIKIMSKMPNDNIKYGEKLIKRVIDTTDDFELLGQVMDVLTNNENIVEICEQTSKAFEIYNSWSDELKKEMKPKVYSFLPQQPTMIEQYVTIADKMNELANTNEMTKANGYKAYMPFLNIKQPFADILIKDFSNTKEEEAMARDLVDPIMRANGYYEKESPIVKALKRIFPKNKNE